MSDTPEICPVCSEGYIKEKVDIGPPNLYYSSCDTCLSEIADVSQINRNKEEMIRFMDVGGKSGHTLSVP